MLAPDDQTPLKRTPLYDLHLSLGARMVPFAGYAMPVQYAAGVLKEHLHTRHKAGLFDVSHMGQVKTCGPQALEFLQRMLSNDPAGLVLMARHMLAAPDRTAELARLELPMLVIYGEDDNAWSPAEQERMAQRLSARRLCIPGAVHSPAVEAPATTASALTQFWDAAEDLPIPHPVAATQTA